MISRLIYKILITLFFLTNRIFHIFIAQSVGEMGIAYQFVRSAPIAARCGHHSRSTVWCGFFWLQPLVEVYWSQVCLHLNSPWTAWERQPTRSLRRSCSSHSMTSHSTDCQYQHPQRPASRRSQCDDRCPNPSQAIGLDSLRRPTKLHHLIVN